MTWRLLVVESTPLAKAKAPRRAAAPHAEWAQLTTRQRPWQQVWRVRWQVQEATEAIAPQAQRERRLVLATNGLDAQQRKDADRWRADKGPPAVELSFQWATNPAAIAPLFPETPTPMAALGGVDLMALLVDTLVERHVRNNWAKRGETLPDRPAPSRRPTARTVCQLLRTMAAVTLVWAGPRHRPVTALKAHQLHVIGLLSDEASIYAPPHRNSG